MYPFKWTYFPFHDHRSKGSGDMKVFCSSFQVSTEFVTSVVVGDDIIPRLSLNAYVKLRMNMKRALLACKLPKHKVLATGLCNCLSPLDWKDTLKIDPAVTGVENQDFEDDVNYGICTYGSEWPTMLPPGKIIHMRMVDGQVNMCFKEPQEFTEILVSTQMINDHQPSSYQKILLAANQRFRTQRNSSSATSSESIPV